MTEFTTDPEAIAHYIAARNRTAHWVDSLSGKTLAAPSFPPSLVDDTDDGLSSQDSDGESSHSLPPRMVLRYPDGRPDVPVTTDTRWPSKGQKPTTPTPFHTRPRAGSGSHGYPPSNPNIHSRAPSNGGPLYVSPPPPVATHPETIHVRPSPTSPTQQGPISYIPPDPHHSTSPSTPARQRSMRSTPSSRPPPMSLQMIYTPPAPAPQSRSAPVSPTRESFQAAQQPPPLPPLSPSHPPIAAPSPSYGFPSPTSAHEHPPPGPPTHSRTHSRSHSYSSNNSYPHPQISPGATSGPPSAYPGTSSQRQRRHSSRTGTSLGHSEAAQPQPQAPAPYTDSSHASMGVGGGPSFASGASGTGSRRRGPPSIVYAPSANSSSYTYNPPVIMSSRQPHGMGPNDLHGRAPSHAHAHRMAPSISDPTPISASVGRNSSRGRMVEHLPRTPSPSTARARGNEGSGAVGSGVAKKDRKRGGSRDNLGRRDGGGDRKGHGDDYNDEAASFSSGSTYYVLPSGPRQKIKVVPPNTMKGLYAEPTKASKSTPALQSHRSQHGPYYSGPAPPPPQPSRPQKRPFLQRIFHLGFGSGGASDPLSASRRGSRR